MTVIITSFPHVKVANMGQDGIKIIERTPEQLYEGFKKYYEASSDNKEEQKHFILAAYNDLNGSRVTENIKVYTGIVIDFDNYTGNYEAFKSELKEDLSGLNYFYYTTGSHTPLTPRVRLILFTNRHFKVDEKNNILINLTQSLSSNLVTAIDQVNCFGNNTLSRFPYKIQDFNMEYVEGNAYFIGDDNMQASTTSIVVDEKADFEKEFKTLTNNLPINDLSEEQIDYYLAEYKKHVGFDENTGWVSYEAWRDIGMVLHHQYQGSEVGLKKWEDWCCESSNKTKYTWNKFKSSKEKPKTFKSIIKELDKNKVKKSLVKSKTNKDLSFEPIDKNLLPDIEIVNKKGKIKALDTYANFVTLVQHYKISIGFDVITKDRVIDGEIDENRGTRKIKDMLIKNGLPYQRAGEFVYSYASDNKFNSFYNLLKAEKWDGKDRLEDFYNTIKVKSEYENRKKAYLKVWLEQFIYLSCFSSEIDINRNSKGISKYILVFQSKQDGGKTTWVKSLMPPSLQNKYVALGAALKTDDDQHTLGLIKKLIVELGELEKSFKHSDINAFKAFFGRPSDIMKVKWITFPVEYERTTSFIASTNDYYFLNDKTGTARFLVLPLDDEYRDEKGLPFCCNGMHDIDMLQLYRQILDTENWLSYKLPEEFKLTQTEHNNEFVLEDTFEELFYEEFTDEISTTAKLFNCTDVLKRLGYSISNINKKLKVDLATFLRKNKFPYRADSKKWRLVEKRKEVKNANNIQEENY